MDKDMERLGKERLKRVRAALRPVLRGEAVHI